MRPWAEKAYGIPPEQVIGSQQEVRFDLRDGQPVLFREPKFAFIDVLIGGRGCVERSARGRDWGLRCTITFLFPR